jgi:class 3 adenylate cyclase/tetratricopeptide (TPR) repeat protein
MAHPVTFWIDAVRDAERRGELLSAFDLAERGLEEYPDDVWLRHRAVLVLARAGSTEEALRRFEEYGLASVDEEDVKAVRARIAKDVALAADGAERQQEAARAAALYGEIFEATGGYYPGINAATLMLLAGEAEEARRLAMHVLEALSLEDPDSYYVAATEAEAEMVLGHEAEARQALARAVALHRGDYGALATTRRQLRLVCQENGFDPELLSGIAGPSIVHFCGHRIAPAGVSGRFPAAAEALVAARIAAEVDRDTPGFAYGALANGADIMCAEALLAVGAELHVVLPFAADEFLRSAVADGGPGWVARFQRCLEAATSVSYATDDAYLGDDVLYRYGTELAMGLALLRARFLDARVRQIAVWDGRATGRDVGTAIAVETWTGHGHPVTVIAPTDEPAAAIAPVAIGRGEATGRVVRAILFADVKGFSKLTDEQLPRFAEHVLGAFARVLDRYGEAVVFCNTWGDAIYAVLTDVVNAAGCALDLQEAMGEVDLVALQLPGHLALRLGAHVGPVFPIRDPMLGTRSFMGSHVSRTARIEPVTPPGAVFATEAFAAALELEHSRFGFDYVGHIPAAKDYGRLRMYRLRPARTPESDRS